MIPEVPDLEDHAVVDRRDWLEARKALLAKERELSHALDALHAERRQLPWVKIDKDYVFQSPQGEVGLADLFQGRSQLAVYHFMLSPGSEHLCKGCSFVADHVDAARQHFEHADLSFCAISRAPLEQIKSVRERMGWRFAWVSAGESDFNYDFGVSFREEDRAAGRAIYNYGTKIESSPDMFGISVFAKKKDGEVYHTYSTYHRGVETTMGALMWLDLVPKGRNEQGQAHSWLRLHDEYLKP